MTSATDLTEPLSTEPPSTEPPSAGSLATGPSERGAPVTGLDRAELNLRGRDEPFVVSIHGDQDRSTSVALAALLDRACRSESVDVLLDLSDVEFMDAAIVRVIMDCSQRLHAESRQLILISPSRTARRVLRLCEAT